MKTDVIVVSPEFGYGGIGTHTLKIVKFLLEEGFRVRVHTTNRSKRITKFFHSNLQVMVIARPIPGFDKFNPFFDLFSSIHSGSEKPDLIIRPTNPYYFYIPQFRNPAKIPELVITHDTFANLSHFFSEEKELKEKFLSSKLSMPLLESEKQILGKAKKIVAVCEYTKRMLMEYYGIEKKRISVIYNPIDINRFSRKKTEEITSKVGEKVKSFKKEKFLVVFVGRPTGAKNLGLLYNVIANSYENLNFVIVGMSENNKYASNYSKRMKGHNVLFLGYIDNNLLPDIYSLADFLIITSLYENLPTCLMEAMACGTIPISVNVGGISEVIREGENGFFVHTYGGKDYLHTIREIIYSDQMLNRVSRNAEKSVRDKFDSKKIKKEFIDIVNETMG